MTTSADIRTAIKALLDGVPNVGIVHDYERYTDKMSKLKTFYVWKSQLRGWHIRRVRQRRRSKDTGRYVVTTRWQIRGYLALKDATQTEKVMDDLLDVIIAEFDNNENLGIDNISTIVDDESGIQLEDSGPVRFADVLCHGVRLALNTRHLE